MLPLRFLTVTLALIAVPGYLLGGDCYPSRSYYPAGYYQAGYYNGTYYPAGYYSASYPNHSTSYPTDYCPPKVVEKTRYVEIPTYTVFPVAYPVYGGTYLPPQTTAQVATVQQQTQAATMPPYTPPVAGTPPQGNVSAVDGKLDMILTAVYGVGNRVTSLENRVGTLERSVSPPPNMAQADPQPQPQPARTTRGYSPEEKAEIRKQAMPVYLKSCAACHDEKNAAKDGKGFVLVKGGQKMNLDALGKSKVKDEMLMGTMPPPNNARKIPALSDNEKNVIIADNLP